MDFTVAHFIGIIGLIVLAVRSIGAYYNKVNLEAKDMLNNSDLINDSNIDIEKEELIEDNHTPDYSRVQHYKFAHQVLRDMFLNDPNSLVYSGLLYEYDLKGLWYDVGKYYAEQDENVIELDGSDISIQAKEFEGVLFVVIQLPKPMQRTEAYFIGLIIPKDTSDKARYITLEYTTRGDDKVHTVLCEWDKQDHLNYGDGGEPTLNHFKDILIDFGKVSVKTWDEAIPTYQSYIGEEAWMIDLWMWADEYNISPLQIPRNSRNLLKIEGLSLSSPEENFDFLPKEIGNLTQLKVFSLQDSMMTELPNEFGNLINLELLYIDGNILSKLPNSICNLVKLKRFFAGDNKIETVPECIGNLKELEVLNLFGNQFTRLPESVYSLTNLNELSVFGNPIEDNIEEMTQIRNFKNNMKERQ